MDDSLKVFDDDPPNPDDLVVKPIKRHAKELQGKAKRHTVMPIDPVNNTYVVTSGGSGKQYTVVMFGDNTGNCNCDWAAKRPLSVAENHGAVGCSHVLAVVTYVAEGHGKHSSAWADEADAKRQHKSTIDIGDGLLVTVAKPVRRKRVQADFLSLVDGNKAGKG